MTAAIDITTEQRKTLLMLLRRFIPGVAVWAYGSRVKWTARPNSDLDLVTFTSPAQSPLVSELKEALAESNLPFLVDFHVWDEVPERFHEIIRKEYVVLQEVKESRGDLVVACDHPITRVGDLADSISETHKMQKEHLIFLNTSDIFHGKILHRNYTDVKDWPGQAKKSICKGDILFSEIRPANGRWAFVEEDGDDYVVSTKLMVIRARKDRVYPKFLYQYLTSCEITSWLQHLAESRSGTFPQITFDEVASLELQLPPLSEQKSIAYIIGTLNEKIELNQRMNATLEEIARALFQSWFVDFDPVRAKLDGHKPTNLDVSTAELFPAHFQDSFLGQIPRGWEVKSISDIGNVICGKTPSTTVTDYYGTDIPFITIPDMHGNVFAASTSRKLSHAGADSQANKTLPPGSICVSCIASPGLVVITADNSQTNQQINSVVPHQRDEHYFWYWVMTGLGAEIASSGSGGSVLANLSKTRFEALQVIYPPHALIRAYHSSVSPLFENILANTRQSHTLATLRDALLPKLLSGDIRVATAENEVTCV